MKKKLLSILLVGVMALSLSACGGERKELEQEESKTEESAEEEPIEYDDIYEVVDEINIDNSEISLKYTGYEIVEDANNDGQSVKRIVLYFDFTNKTSISMSATSSFYTQAFQGGIEMQGWGGSNLNESLENEAVDIMDGATINVGFLFDLHDEKNPVKFRVSESLVYEGENQFAQQQEINIK